MLFPGAGRQRCAWALDGNWNETGTGSGGPTCFWLEQCGDKAALYMRTLCQYGCNFVVLFGWAIRPCLKYKGCTMRRSYVNYRYGNETVWTHRGETPSQRAPGNKSRIFYRQSNQGRKTRRGFSFPSFTSLYVAFWNRIFCDLTCSSWHKNLT